MDKILNYDELMSLALANYNKGGDSVYECWGQKDFDDYIKEFGPMTKRAALDIFALDLAVYNDYQATAW